jgi:23S rRNA pseudouridine1911/1915/1917 synthase
VVKVASFVATRAHDGRRLDKLVGEALPTLSRTQLQELFAGGLVHVDGQPAAKGQLARTGQRVEVLDPLESSTTSRPALGVVYETDAVVIVDKPPGQPSAPRFDRDGASVASALLEAYPNMEGIGFSPGDAGLLSRLDTDTSGLLLAAKAIEAFRELRADTIQASGRLSKGYLALVSGGCDLQPSSIEVELGPHVRNRRKVATGSHIRGTAKPAKTQILSVQPGASVSVVTLSVARAYRHQVRVHLAHVGWPLLGDELYGGARHPALTRHALHAHRLTWSGGTYVDPFDVSLPLADDLLAVVSPRD